MDRQKKWMSILTVLLVIVIPLAIASLAGCSGSDPDPVPIPDPVPTPPSQFTTGHIVGYVYAQDGEDAGEPIAGAVLQCDGESERAGSDGYYWLEQITAGSQVVTVSALGYADYSADVVVEGGTTVTHDIYMNVGEGSVPEPQEGVVYNSANGHYYEYVDATLTWEEALVAATERTHNGLSGHLATITSSDENTFVTSNLTFATAAAWAGGYQERKGSEPSGSWKWVTDEVWSYTNWRSTEPNNDGDENALHVYSADSWAGGAWNDHSGANDWQGYIVEYDSYGFTGAGTVFSNGGHYYEHVDATLTWDEARIAALQRSYSGLRGHLVAITSSSENDFVTSNLTFAAADAWAGGYQQDGGTEPDGGWGWVTGETWSYTNWRDTEPNDDGDEDVIRVYSAGSWANSAWNDRDSSESNQGYIVEYQ